MSSSIPFFPGFHVCCFLLPSVLYLRPEWTSWNKGLSSLPCSKISPSRKRIVKAPWNCSHAFSLWSCLTPIPEASAMMPAAVLLHSRLAGPQWFPFARWGLWLYSPFHLAFACGISSPHHPWNTCCSASFDGFGSNSKSLLSSVEKGTGIT